VPAVHRRGVIGHPGVWSTGERRGGGGVEPSGAARREGLYSSHVIEWTRARGAGALDRFSDSRMFGETAEASVNTVRLKRLRARNETLEAELKKTRTALDTMGKAHALPEQLSESADDQEPPMSPKKS
jgi:transposase